MKNHDFSYQHVVKKLHKMMIPPKALAENQQGNSKRSWQYSPENP